jgi:hypothetical protein
MSRWVRRGLFLAALLVAVRLGRETVWGSHAHAGWPLSVSSRTQGDNSTLSMRQAPLRGAASTCSISAHGSSDDVDRGISKALVGAGCVDVPGAPLRWTINVEADDGACLLPLFKRYQVHFEANVNFGILDEHGAAAGDLHVGGDITVDAAGLYACRTVRERAGREIGDIVANHVLTFQRAN